MADPATITLAVKAAVALATDKRTWRAIGVIITSILTPIILIVVMISSILSAGADHNKAAIDLSFNGRQMADCFRGPWESVCTIHTGEAISGGRGCSERHSQGGGALHEIGIAEQFVRPVSAWKALFAGRGCPQECGGCCQMADCIRGAGQSIRAICTWQALSYGT